MSGGAGVPAEVERIARGVLEGAAFRHEEGVVHGDFEPEDILLDEKGEPKIADLGLSRAHALSFKGRLHILEVVAGRESVVELAGD